MKMESKKYCPVSQQMTKEIDYQEEIKKRMLEAEFSINAKVGMGVASKAALEVFYQLFYLETQMIDQMIETNNINPVLKELHVERSIFALESVICDLKNTKSEL